MLAIEVSFLLGRYAAADHRDRGRAEWPPHPGRLFSALAAAAARLPDPAPAWAALRWLEGLGPPHLHADPDPARQSVETVFVPVNDPAGPPFPDRPDRQPRTFPSVVPADPAVAFVWPDAAPPPAAAAALAAVARAVTYLGSSRSPVLARLRPDPPAPNWVPDPDGDVFLRVPGPGRLADLDWHFRQGLRPTPGPAHGYRLAGTPPPAGAAGGAFGELFIFRVTGPAGLGSEMTLRVTEALRAAAMSRAQEVLGEVPAVLSGHDPDGRRLGRTHAAYLPLPFASPTQAAADGRLDGVAVALPKGLPTADRRRAARALAAVDHLALGPVGRFALSRVAPGEPAPLRLRAETWVGPGRVWASVTPVVLDRFPKGEAGVGAEVARACRNAGLPAPAEVAVGRHSPLHGVPPSDRFPTRRPGKAGPPRPFAHVVVRFPGPVAGPVVVGAGRYFGLGLLRPVPEGRP